ncbi:GSCOCG00009122001-RA-CDS [Cotesia congregata]|uniref:Josephin-2 n=1 Tax=Cotesia congregata TaxID=51543 RepID=A0A8J2HAA8_COTCN|nr:GSCOCG00009122001-RA-CDS [Cotesia congregata]CAG5089814.1 Similar to JOSD2: Josephin-2 (Homo sapiens) [Cotesia congregata]
MTGSIYHERQVKELCALHALNNLFQERGFSKQELDQICYGLSPDVWINPHKSLLGLGNYDINVIMAALQKKGCEAIWFDKRRDLNSLNLDKIDGFILNVPTEYKLGFVLLPLKKRHWIALRKIKGAFYNLDSKLDSPVLIGNNDELIAYLKDQILSKEKELLLVVSREIANNQDWLIKLDNGNDIINSKKFIENNDDDNNKYSHDNDENNHRFINVSDITLDLNNDNQISETKNSGD